MALELEIDISEIEKFIGEFADLDAFIGDELESAMVKALAVLEGAIVSRTPVNTGALRGSIISNRFGQPLGMYTGEVSTPLQYGMPVEHGRRAGTPPPVAPILMWVTRKLGLRGSEAKSAAYAIARAIGARGTKPGAQMFAKGFDASVPSINAIYDAIPGKIIARLAA